LIIQIAKERIIVQLQSSAKRVRSQILATRKRDNEVSAHGRVTGIVAKEISGAQQTLLKSAHGLRGKVEASRSNLMGINSRV
jgi:hypothetical protein